MVRLATVVLVLVVSVGCDDRPKTPAEIAAKQREESNRRQKEKLAAYEGRDVYNGLYDVYWHVRSDCPSMKVIDVDGKKVEPKKYVIRSGRIVDQKGFFFDDKMWPCKTCIP